MEARALETLFFVIGKYASISVLLRFCMQISMQIDEIRFLNSREYGVPPFRPSRSLGFLVYVPMKGVLYRGVDSDVPCFIRAVRGGFRTGSQRSVKRLHIL